MTMPVSSGGVSGTCEPMAVVSSVAMSRLVMGSTVVRSDCGITMSLMICTNESPMERAASICPTPMALMPLMKFSEANDDTTKITPETFEELLYQAFDTQREHDSVIICKSNKRANLFNQAIRSRILNIEGEIATGDLLMVVKNNYYWADGNKEIRFIANGDLAEIKKIVRYEEMYGFRFADVMLSFPDYPEAPAFDVKILLDTLNSNSASLTEEESMKLRLAIEEDYMDIPNRRERYKEMRKNPWFNALQVKFAYALTCHKTQGGQWREVFVDSSMNQKDELEKEDIRWLYTALTRAQERLYFVNFKEEFFG